MRINDFKPILSDKLKTYKDPFRIKHDRSMAKIVKEKKIQKRYDKKDLNQRNAMAIKEERIVLKENNERWKLLNII